MNDGINLTDAKKKNRVDEIHQFLKKMEYFKVARFVCYQLVGSLTRSIKKW